MHHGVECCFRLTVVRDTERKRSGHNSFPSLSYKSSIVLLRGTARVLEVICDYGLAVYIMVNLRIKISYILKAAKIFRAGSTRLGCEDILASFTSERCCR